MSSSDSGVLDDILSVTTLVNTDKPNSQNLEKESFSGSSRRTKESGMIQLSSSKTTLDSGANASQTINSHHGEQEVTLHKKIDLLMGLVQDMAPVVKTLQEAYDASLLQDGDDDPLSFSESDEEPPRKRSRSEQTSDKQPSSNEATEPATGGFPCH